MVSLNQLKTILECNLANYSVIPCIHFIRNCLDSGIVSEKQLGRKNKTAPGHSRVTLTWNVIPPVDIDDMKDRDDGLFLDVRDEIG